MRISKVLIIILLLPFLLYSCSDDSPAGSSSLDTASFIYPFQIGNSWSYRMTISLSDFKPDSIRPYLNGYPMTITGSVTVLYDTIIYGVTTRCFYDANQQYPPGSACRYYYLNNDTGLILYAVRGGLSSFLPTDIDRDVLLLNGKLLPHNINGNSANPDNDSLYVTPGNIILKYPVITGTEWIYYSNGYPAVRRKYSGFEFVSLPIGTFSCMNAEKTYLAISYASYHDYYSKYGIMKRTSFLDDILFTTPEYPEGIGTVDISSVTDITGYTLH